MPKFLTVADGKIAVASRLKLGTFIIILFFASDGGRVIKISVLLKFKLRKLEFSQAFSSVTQVDSDVVW